MLLLLIHLCLSLAICPFLKLKRYGIQSLKKQVLVMIILLT
jgi:hypothetical protein